MGKIEEKNAEKKRHARVLLEVCVDGLRKDAHPALRQVDVVRLPVHGQEGLVQAHGGGVVGQGKPGDQGSARDRPGGLRRGRVQEGRVLQLLRPELDFGEGQVEAHGEGQGEQVGAWGGGGEGEGGERGGE